MIKLAQRGIDKDDGISSVSDRPAKRFESATT